MTTQQPVRTDADLELGSWNVRVLEPLLAAMTVGEALIALAQERDDVVVVSADMRSSNRTGPFAERFPDRFHNVGIAEQNALGIAAGMASCGLTPYVTLFACFASLTGAEQLRTDLAFTGMPVRVIAHHAGIALSFYGTSHYALEDIALTRAMTGMTVVSAADGAALRALVRGTVDVEGPVYLRCGAGLEQPVYDAPPAFVPGRFHRVREGRDLTVIATGSAVRHALDAAELAAEADGLDVRVLDAVWLKPLDREAVLAAARETGGILTVEEHNLAGGLGSAVAATLGEAGVATRLRMHGIGEEHVEMGTPWDLYAHYGYCADGLANHLRQLAA